jgi:hypothetical protein
MKLDDPAEYVRVVKDLVGCRDRVEGESDKALYNYRGIEENARRLIEGQFTWTRYKEVLRDKTREAVSSS